MCEKAAVEADLNDSFVTWQEGFELALSSLPDVYHCRLDISSKNKGNAIAEITDTSDRLKPEKIDQAWVLTVELVNEMSD